MKTLGRQTPYGIINLCWLFRTDNVKHEFGREYFVTPDSKSEIFLVKECITYPRTDLKKKLIYYTGLGGEGAGEDLAPPFLKEIKYFSIALKNVLTMVNSYTRQF